jgi:DNA polymerase II small subunit
MPDDVVGVLGRLKSDRGKRDTFIVENIYFPPLQQHEKNSAPVDQAVSVAFLSDVHLGSKTFLDAQWHKMVEWFNTDPLARTIRYFVISGDGVDGVGIYPNQEKELAIPDLFNQYGGLAKLLEPLPDWVDVMLLPGNHDAVRPAEPQPALDPELQQDYNNTTFVGNPCDFSLHGVRILSYHGKSIDDFVSKMRNVSYDRPEAAMRAMIDRRHLAPSWGAKTPLSPEPEDNLVIRTIPDIFVTGHVHGHHVSDYKGVKLIHSSTWQDQTGYQRTLGFQPRPAILTVVNLHTHETASIPFA